MGEPRPKASIMGKEHRELSPSARANVIMSLSLRLIKLQKGSRARMRIDDRRIDGQTGRHAAKACS